MSLRSAWGGWIAMTLNFLPALGVTGAHRNLHYAAGYNGHGVAAACALGASVAAAVLGRPDPHAERFRCFAVPLPPEPLRWLLVRSILGVVNAIVRRRSGRVAARLTASVSRSQCIGSGLSSRSAPASREISTAGGSGRSPGVWVGP